MNQITLSVETINKVLNYLSERPYKEVAEIIAAVINEANKVEDSKQIVDENKE